MLWTHWGRVTHICVNKLTNHHWLVYDKLWSIQLYHRNGSSESMKNNFSIATYLSSPEWSNKEKRYFISPISFPNIYLHYHLHNNKTSWQHNHCLQNTGRDNVFFQFKTWYTFVTVKSYVILFHDRLSYKEVQIYASYYCVPEKYLCWQQQLNSGLVLAYYGIFTGPLFIKWLGNLPNIVKPQSYVNGLYHDCIPLKFDKHLSSTAAEVPVKLSSDWKSLNLNLVASRLWEILW